MHLELDIISADPRLSKRFASDEEAHAAGFMRLYICYGGMFEIRAWVPATATDGDVCLLLISRMSRSRLPDPLIREAVLSVSHGEGGEPVNVGTKEKPRLYRRIDWTARVDAVIAATASPQLWLPDAEMYDTMSALVHATEEGTSKWEKTAEGWTQTVPVRSRKKRQAQ